MKLVVHWWILFLCLPIFFLQSRKVSGQCRDYEQEALLEVKNGFFNFSPHAGIATWRPDLDCCKWEGIVCNKDTGNVASLDISNSSIKGYGVSSRILALEDLEVLNLAYNEFHSSIPSELGRFSKLTHLNLSNSGFSGQIPLEISKMTLLVSLDLSSSNRDFPYRFSSLKLENPDLSTLIRDLINLKQLYLGGQNISSEVPISINKLSALESLNLRGCSLSGDFPEEVFSLKNLTNLDISHNRDLRVDIPELPKNNVLRSLKLSSTNFSWMSSAVSLSKLYFLTRLDVSRCAISGPLPYWTSTLKSLVYLDMSGNDLVGDIRSLQNLTELVHLDLSFNSFTGSILSLKNLTKLVHLDLSYNSFIRGLCHIKNLSQLSYLNLGRNNFNEDSSTFMRELGNLMNLTHLDLSANEFTGEISFIDNLTRLNALHISFNNFSGSIPSFSSLQNLKKMDLSSNHFQGKIPRSYGNLSNLCILRALGNLIEGPIPFSLFYHPSLEYLYLSKNRLHIITEEENINLTTSKLIHLDLSSNNLKGPIPSSLFYHPSLKYLYLDNNSLNIITEEENINVTTSKLRELHFSYNNLKGPIPSFLFHYPYLTTLDLSHSFRGEIPQDIGELKSLRLLHISGNHLIGPIPPSIGNIRNLESLDLSVNNLSGRIPVELTSLTFLSRLNLSMNNLEGRIPEGNQFNTFNEESFLGNPGLCGQPLPIKCSENSRPYVNPEEGTSGSVIETTRFTFPFGFVSGLIIGVLVGNIVTNKRLKAHVNQS